VAKHDRQSTRHRTEIRVRYRTHDENITRFTEDVSAGGLFIRTLAFLPINTVLPLYLQLPDEDEEIAVIARIAHVLGTEQAVELDRSPGMGFEFLDLAPEARVRLERCEVTRRSKDLPIPGVAPPGPVTDVRGCRILLVEDEGFVQRRIGGLFMRRGLRLGLAATGVEALTKCLQTPPDLVLSDIVMPAMDGWALLRMLKARPELTHVPFVFLSGRVTERDRRQAYEMGADDCIPKATPPEEILDRVVRVLSRYREDPQEMDQRRVLQGNLSHVTLATVIQMLNTERRSGQLTLQRKGCSARVDVREGKPVSCHIDPFDLTGRDALIELLDWDAGQFEFAPGEYTGDDEIGMSVVQLLMEHARLADDAEQD